MTVVEYRDIEYYCDELYMAVPLNKVVRLCRKINVSFEELYDLPCHDDIFPRNIINSKITEKNLSTLELSDFVGIEEFCIKEVAEDIVNIGDWVIDPIIWLTDKLEIDFGSFLNSYSEYKGQEKR